MTSTPDADGVVWRLRLYIAGQDAEIGLGAGQPE